MPDDDWTKDENIDFNLGEILDNIRNKHSKLKSRYEGHLTFSRMIRKTLEELKTLIYGYERRHPDGDVEEELGIIRENEVQHSRLDYEIKKLKEQVAKLGGDLK